MMAPMTTARTGHGAVLIRKEIYVVGGKTGPNYDNSMEVYDCLKNKWVKKAPMNNTNAYFGVRLFSDKHFFKHTEIMPKIKSLRHYPCMSP